MHLQNTFCTLKNKFLGMIDYWDETLQSVTVGEEGNMQIERKDIARGSSIPLKAKNQIAYEMDVLTDVVE